MKHTILLVEDELGIRETVKIFLKSQNYEVIEAENGKEGLEALQNNDIHLAIVDIMMPVMDGLTMTMKLREVSDIPVIFLTAKTEDIDKITGLNLGADDYITKPFAIEELLARVRAFFRREEHGHAVERAENTSFRDLVIDKTNRTVHRGKKVIDLTRREYDLLLTLMQNVGDVVTREHLVSQVWGYEEGTETNVVDVYIRYLRNKIDVEGQDSYIQTVRGLGYVMRERK